MRFPFRVTDRKALKGCLPFTWTTHSVWIKLRRAWNWWKNKRHVNGTKLTGWNVPIGKRGQPFQTNRLFRKSSGWDVEICLFHLLSVWNHLNFHLNGKQPQYPWESISHYWILATGTISIMIGQSTLKVCCRFHELMVVASLHRMEKFSKYCNLPCLTFPLGNFLSLSSEPEAARRLRASNFRLMSSLRMPWPAEPCDNLRTACFFYKINCEVKFNIEHLL
jgi:hypothetical protein